MKSGLSEVGWNILPAVGMYGKLLFSLLEVGMYGKLPFSLPEVGMYGKLLLDWDVWKIAVWFA